MSRCPRPDEVELFFDGEVSEPEKQDFVSHLRNCEHCSKELEFQQRLRKLLHCLPADELVRHRIHSQLAASPERRRRHITLPTRVATILLIALGLSLLGNVYFAVGGAAAVISPVLSRMEALRPAEPTEPNVLEVSVDGEVRLLEKPVIYIEKLGFEQSN